MKAKWLLGATLALLGVGSITIAQDSSGQRQPPPPPAQNDNQTPPANDNRTPPAPTNDHQNLPPARADNPVPASPSSNPPPAPSAGSQTDVHRTDVQASGQVNTQGQFNAQGQPIHSQIDRTGVQANGQFQTGQQTQFDQRGVAVGGQVQSDQWQWPAGRVQQGYTQGGYTQGSYTQGQYQPGQVQSWRVQGQYQPGYSQGGWVQPGQYQGGWVQQGGQYQPGYAQGQVQQGYTQGQYQPGYTQNGQVPMDQSASMGSQNFHRAKQVLGTHVSIEGGLAIGVVEDIVFADNGNIEFLVIANEGKLVSVPWSAARFNFEQRQATVAINQEQFQQIPTFTASAWPTFDPQYRTQVYGYFGNRAGYVTPGQERRMDRQMDRGGLFNRGRR